MPSARNIVAIILLGPFAALAHGEQIAIAFFAVFALLPPVGMFLLVRGGWIARLTGAAVTLATEVLLGALSGGLLIESAEILLAVVVAASCMAGWFAAREAERLTRKSERPATRKR